MKNSTFFTIILLIFNAFVQASCQSNQHSAPGGKSVFISKTVLETAKWAEFDYKKHLDQSLRGNLTSMQSFFEFMTYVDGAERTEHAVTCLEILPVVGDQVFSLAVQNLKPRFRDVFRNQMVFAIGKTEHPDIKGKQIAEYCPYTWAALNHAPIFEGAENKNSNGADAQQAAPSAAPATDAAGSGVGPATSTEKPAQKSGGNH